jgi:homoserine kinase
MKQIEITVPATSANLGPGFDTLGMALDIIDTVTVEFEGDGEETCLEEAEALDLGRHENLLCRAYREYAHDVGTELPAAKFRLESGVPVGKGFGSSAASIVAGLSAAAYAAERREDVPRLLRLAARIEGHADNTTPAILGGMTVAVRDGDEVHALNVANHFSFGIALYLPEEALRTSDARAALPERVTHADAVFNVSRAAYLVTALLWGRWEEIGVGMDDRLHQQYRALLVPAFPEVATAARGAGAYGAALSGGGPSIIAIGPRDGMAEIGEAMEVRARDLGWPGRALLTGVRHRGVEVKVVE